MQLVLTADRRYWGDAKNVLFLGEWCKLYRDREAWTKLSFQTLPYHWDDRDRYARDSEFVARLSETYLSALGTALNRLHGVEYPLLTWRVVLGPWLNTFIAVLYDRFLSIEAAIRTDLVTKVCIEPAGSGDWPVRDTHRFFCGVLDDKYNLHLYSELLRARGGLPVREISAIDLSAPSTHPLDNPSRIKKWAKQIARTWTRMGSGLSPGHVFVSSYLSRGNLLSLQRKLRQIPAPDFFPDTEGDWSVCALRRDRLATDFPSFPDSSFSRILTPILLREIPRIFVEGFRDLEQSAKAIFPASAKTIFTANAHVHHEAFKLWAGQQRAHGTPLIISQHGGQTGVGKWCLADAHDQKIADHYFSWGWKHADLAPVRPMPSGKLRRIKATPHSAGKILLVMNGFPRYFYRSYSVPVGRQVLDYLSDQVRFIEGLNPSMRSELLVRPYFIDYRWEEAARLRDAVPGIEFSRAHTFAEDLNRSRLFIGNHNTTTLLETLSADFPTLLFWNPKHWELHPEAQKYWERLTAAGIFFADPAAAAMKVNEIGNDPQSWWQSESIQTVRRDFCRKFAYATANWQDEWASALRQIHRGSTLQRSKLNLSFSHGDKGRL